MVTKEVLEKAITLVKRDPNFLTELEKQRQFITSRQLEERPCPECNKGVSTFDAAPASWDGDFALYDYVYTCPYCKTPLMYQLAFFGGVQSWVKDVERG